MTTLTALVQQALTPGDDLRQWVVAALRAHADPLLPLESSWNDVARRYTVNWSTPAPPKWYVMITDCAPKVLPSTTSLVLEQFATLNAALADAIETVNNQNLRASHVLDCQERVVYAVDYEVVRQVVEYTAKARPC